MSDKIAEIRARHEVDTEVAAVLNLPTWARAGWQAHNDRTTLLAEVERLREALKSIDELNPDALDALVSSDLRDIVAQMGDLAVKALEGKP